MTSTAPPSTALGMVVTMATGFWHETENQQYGTADADDVATHNAGEVDEADVLRESR